MPRSIYSTITLCLLLFVCVFQEPSQAQNQSGLALSAPPAAPASLLTSLSIFRSLTVAGDYVASGIGLRDTTQGNITISDLPAGAVVLEAYLYWGMLDNGESPSLKNLNFNGTPLVGTLVGNGPDTNWNRTNSFAYRANVTTLVAGNGTYHLTGVASGGTVIAQGASLVIIYQRSGDPSRNVILLDGDLVYKTTADSLTAMISGFLAVAPVSAKTTFIVGDGQDTAGEIITFTGGAGTATFNNPFDGSDGQLWDTDTFIVSSQLKPGDSTATANMPPLQGDSIMWIAQVFSVTTMQPFDLCLQDESNGNLLQLNTTTGEYQFTNCAGLTIGGTGTLTKRGGLITLQHNAADRRVRASIDTATKRATASIQLFSQGRTFSITDRNISNNTCACQGAE